jgi:UDP-N-acetyl-D-glucosamine dehydrogenase
MLTVDDIESRTARVVVIGVGMAGLYQCFEFASHGFHVVGFDVDEELIGVLGEGHSPVPDVPDEDLRRLLALGRFEPTSDSTRLSGGDVFVISVPVVPTATGHPEVGSVGAAARLVARVATAPLVVVKSTGYPGMTEEVVLPVLAGRFGEPGDGFCLVYAPERADPGSRTLSETSALPKVLGGLTPRCERLGRVLYEVMGGTVHVASSLATAELVKLHENVFRFVNISYVNELADVAERQGIDPIEVIDLAGTKPFGFMGFRPGAGVGGMYIPVNPVLMKSWVERGGATLETVDAAVAVNNTMASRVADRIAARAGRSLAGCVIAAMGLTYKPGSTDLRNSAATRVVEELARRGAFVVPIDPHAVGRHIPGAATPVRDWTPAALQGVDIAVVLVAHPEFNSAPIAVDVVVDVTRPSPSTTRTRREAVTHA